MSEATHVQKLLYLGGKRVSDEHRGWLKELLEGEDRRKLGLALALPNAVVMIFFGLLSFATKDSSFGIILFAGAAVVLTTGALVPFLIRGRVKYLTKKNKF